MRAHLLATVTVLGLLLTSEASGTPLAVIPMDSIAEELPLPNVPQELRTPGERAAYVTAHFWDSMDFGDTLRTRDAYFMELNFVNYASLLPHTAEGDRRRAMDILLTKAGEGDAETVGRLCDVADKYLGDRESPVRCEEALIDFYEAMAESPALEEGQRQRAEAQLSVLTKNRVGTVATDFTYTSRQGERKTLAESKGGRLLLVFYDPTCPHCTEVMDELNASPLIRLLTEGGSLRLLAVYAEGDRKLWDETKGSIAEAWEVGADEEGIVERGLYMLGEMPVMYLLDEGGTVVLKDPTAAQLLDYLAR